MASKENSALTTGSSFQTDFLEKSTPLKKKIIFFVNSEYGQANVVLSVVYELLLRREYEVHIMSFTPLKGRIEALNKLALADESNSVIFHKMPGLSILQALERKPRNFGPFQAGAKGALKTYRITLPTVATAWTGPEYIEGYKACLETLKSLKPNIVVIDPLMDQATDACKTLTREYVILSPNTCQDILRKQQPLFHRILRYPATSSAFPYPVPWSLVLLNVYLKISMIWILVTSPVIKALISYRKSQNLLAIPPAFDVWQKENHYLVPSVPETDFPCVLQPNLTPCGPILLPVPAVSDVDKNLLEWLESGPTVLINLGSHIRMDTEMARQFSVGLKVLLDRRPKIQILWKLKVAGGAVVPNFEKTESGSSEAEHEERLDLTIALDPITAEINSGRVKVMDWMTVDPLAVLQSGNIVCSIHHGGSNSFHEAISVGVPQIILPVWLDTFEFAHRVEYLGIGVFGSKAVAPRVEAVELSKALMRVLGGGDEGYQMSLKAKELAAIAGKAGGRARACEKIIEILES